jgi:hypothetical protein
MADDIRFQGLRGQLKSNEPMSRHSSWRAGGPARRCFAPADLEDLSAFLAQLPERADPVCRRAPTAGAPGGWPGTVVLTYAPGRAPRMDEGCCTPTRASPARRWRALPPTRTWQRGG